jgi:hypothetical protein
VIHPAGSAACGLPAAEPKTLHTLLNANAAGVDSRLQRPEGTRRRGEPCAKASSDRAKASSDREATQQ